MSAPLKERANPSIERTLSGLRPPQAAHVKRLGVMKMEYELVLQFACSSDADFDSVIETEDQLVSALGESGVVDGHDSGSGQANIFILTSAPIITFSQVRGLLQSKGLLKGKFKAAYRSVTGSQYTVLWPESSGEFSVI
jgi:hypothetical protein